MGPSLAVGHVPEVKSVGLIETWGNFWRLPLRIELRPGGAWKPEFWWRGLQWNPNYWADRQRRVTHVTARVHMLDTSGRVGMHADGAPPGAFPGVTQGGGLFGSLLLAVPEPPMWRRPRALDAVGGERK